MVSGQLHPLWLPLLVLEQPRSCLWWELRLLPGLEQPGPQSRVEQSAPVEPVAQFVE